MSGRVDVEARYLARLAGRTCTNHADCLRLWRRWLDARGVALPGATADLLRAAAGGRAARPLLVHPRTGRPWTKTAERARLARLLVDTGLPHVTAYGLRTGFITLALAAGVPERDVMISARHTSSAQTARYDRMRGQVERAAGPRLEAWLRLPSQTGAPQQEGA